LISTAYHPNFIGELCVSDKAMSVQRAQLLEHRTLQFQLAKQLRIRSYDDGREAHCHHTHTHGQIAGRSDFVTRNRGSESQERDYERLSSMKKEGKAVGSKKKRSYTKPTATKLTQEQAKRFVVECTGCSNPEAEEVLQSLRGEQQPKNNRFRKAS
jgi:hypothetical protein